MQVEIFETSDIIDLEKAINNFIEGKDIIDIKYQTNTKAWGDHYSALVMYGERTIRVRG